MLFSERKGLKRVRKTHQKESMDEALRNGLWDALDLCIWRKVIDGAISSRVRESEYYELFVKYWHFYFKKPVDSMPSYLEDVFSVIRDIFFKAEWYEVYDLVEFTSKVVLDDMSNGFDKACNQVLEREMSAYRIVDHNVVEITSEQEIESIESAIRDSTGLAGVNEHLASALQLLSDRKRPDFRNSIKESILALESLSKRVAQDEKATLGTALKMLEDKIELHGALKNGFSALYGYTSSANGIRHGMLEKTTITFVDAKFMIVACSAFINYVIGKCSEADITLE